MASINRLLMVEAGGVLAFSKYNGIFRSVHTIYVEEGVRGMYRGYSAAMLSFPVYFSLYFPTYEWVKAQFNTTALSNVHDFNPRQAPPFSRISLE